MITAAQLRQKAENRYREVLKEMLRGNDPFPLKVRYPRPGTSGDLQELRKAIQAIKSQSKESLKFGYTVEWHEVETRKFSRNLIPGDIAFASAEDFFGYIEKQAEASEILAAANLIRSRYPAAFAWTLENHRFLSDRATGFWEALFEVIDFLTRTPFPELFARELPIPVPTKFIEENQGIVESLLRTVSPESVRPERETFAERLGLKSPESLIEVRLLDPSLAPDLPLIHFTASASQMGAGFFQGLRGVLITENRLTFLTLPPLPGILAILGQGYAITRMARLPWLAGLPLFYWGDIDVEGFEILALLRRTFPQTESLLMNETTWGAHRTYAVAGSPRKAVSLQLLEYLTPEEQALASTVAASNLRLEQERIPFAATVSFFLRQPSPSGERSYNQTHGGRR